MIRIEQFLFENNVEQTQSEYLMSEYPNLMFNTMQEFQDFFDENRIKLNKNTSLRARQDAFPEKQELLQRFKEFKSSTDYDYVRQYIIEQRKIQDAINAGNVEFASNFLDGITNKPVDPFFNFVVRKILTGSETGILPSERLRTLLDELLQRKKPEIDTEPDVVRDELNRVKSFDNYLKNKGSLKVDLLDERFTLDVFQYTVDRSFKQLEEAKNAESNILKRATELSGVLPDSQEGLDEKTLVDGLKQLVIQDSNSTAGLKEQVKDLEKLTENLANLVNQRDLDVNQQQRIITELTNQFNQQTNQLVIKDNTITSLNEIIDTTITDLQTNVSSQLTNTAEAFDTLAAKIEENSTKQLESFEKAITGVTEGLTEALKPKEPEPDPGNPAAEIITKILEKWDKMTVITESSYGKFEEILNKLGAKKPIKSTYVFTPPAADNLYYPSEEVKQHLKWNNELKPQIKELVVSITEKKDAETILKNVDFIINDKLGSLNNEGLFGTIVNSIERWAGDAASVRGVATPFIRRIAQEIGANFPNSNDLGGNIRDAAAGATAIKAKLTRNTDQLINILTILDEAKNNLNTGFGW